MSNSANNGILTDGNTLTQAAGHTIQGAGRLLDDTGGMVNQGTIIADEATAITIDPNALGFTNQGTMQSTGAGGFVFDGGTFTNQGTMQATGAGGFVFNSGTFTNTGQTIDVQAGSKLDINAGVTIDGGTLQSTGTGVINVLSSFTNTASLNNVTTEGTVVQGDNREIDITGVLTNNATWQMNSAGSGTVAFLSFQGNTTLGGTGEVVMNNLNNDRILANSNTLTQAAGHTIRGTGGLLSFAGGMVNQGTIIADEATAITIYPNALGFTNQGTMQATGAGGFKIQATGSSAFETSGTVSVGNGSQISIIGAYTQTGGTTTLDGGDLIGLSGNITPFDFQGGSLTGNGNITGSTIFGAGATIAAGFSPGILNFNNASTFNGLINLELAGLLVDGAAPNAFAVNLGTDPSTTQFDQLNVFDTATLVDGLTFDVDVLPEFTTIQLGDFFDVFTADLFSLSSLANMNFVFQDGWDFSRQIVSFDGRQALRLTATSVVVPEPSTVVLLLTGLVGLIGLGRRKACNRTRKAA